MEDVWVYSSFLTPHLRTRLTLHADEISCCTPEALFDLIPIGNRTSSAPLLGLSQVLVEPRLERRRLFTALLAVLFGLLSVSQERGVLTVLMVVTGGVLAVDAIRAQLTFLDVTGPILRLPVSYLHRKRAWGFARMVNTVLVSRALRDSADSEVSSEAEIEKTDIQISVQPAAAAHSNVEPGWTAVTSELTGRPFGQLPATTTGTTTNDIEWV